MKTSKMFIGATVLSAVLYLGYTHPVSKKAKNVVKQTAVTLKLQTMATGVRSPMNLAFLNDGSGKILVEDQIGVISFIENNTISKTPFLDLRSKMVKVNDSYDERGLLGLALHPDFKTNKKFYVYYSAPSSTAGSNHKAVVAEFKVGANGLADMSSEKVLLTVEEPESNHNGGCLRFGPDGYLYMSFGDGGGAGDKHGTEGNGQILSTLLGKILRIDVNKGTPYAIPTDNPFVGKDAKPEIWAYGLRNTWRFSFDRKSGQLFASDVGQDTYEEVDIIEKGGNYGWRIMEATHCFNPKTGCKVEGLKLPINEYPHTVGVSITGGYVYNGKAFPDLTGHYIFADWTGKMFNLHKTGTTWTRDNITLSNQPDGFKVLAFAEDAAGELYVLANLGTGTADTKGVVYKLVK